MARNLKPVPDDNDAAGSPPQRAVTTSFRIPVFWMNRVKDEARRLDISQSQVYLRALVKYFETFESESWETISDADAYDPSRFYTHSEDRKGHSFHVRTNIPKPLAGEMGSLVQSGMVPAYRSIGDIARDAIVHRVKQISQMIEAGTLEQTVDMAMMLADEMQMQDEAEHAEQLIERMRANAQSLYMRQGTKARLKKYLAQRRDLAANVPEQYRKEYIGVIVEFEKRIAKEEDKAAKPRRRTRK